MAMARSLLKGTHMSARFWGEGVRHAFYLLNRLPTKALGERTSFEAWMGRMPHLAHLRVFNCVAYVKNTAPHLKKPDDRSSPMVYLGVEEGCKAHRLFDPRHGKLQVSRDVMFRENCEWTWNAGANNKEKVPEFMVVDAFGTDEVIVTADIEATVEDVTTPAVVVVPMTGASSPSTPSSNTHTTSSPSITNSPDSYEGPVRFRSIDDIYANTEEVVGIDEEEGEVMMVISEEPTCYQEDATETCCLASKKCTQEHAVYTRGKGEASILVGVYVDDLIVTGSSTEKINKFKQQMMTKFEMSDLGLLSYYLGIEVEQQKSRILLRQSAYAKKILSQFKMADCNATNHLMEPKTQLHKDLEGTLIDATEYKHIIGCLRYLLHTRSDLSYSVGMAPNTWRGLQSCITRWSNSFSVLFTPCFFLSLSKNPTLRRLLLIALFVASLLTTLFTAFFSASLLTALFAASLFAASLLTTLFVASFLATLFVASTFGLATSSSRPLLSAIFTTSSSSPRLSAIFVASFSPAPPPRHLDFHPSSLPPH
ncbi:hypothetical protein ZIOFF_066484 [Zingiber officinale]|uniref:Reverse transcriptase Ty1/copia-type domain-containing protein n=1 Tax=Zingiber officinale TaxID=94328 RepID=A0A8J5EYI4_ZINOF|nr:hypothetical protein ZIOFF_066484 [Zingiber officinale]